MRNFYFFFCLVLPAESTARYQEWDKWSGIERHGNHDVNYTEMRLAGWRVFVDDRLTRERGNKATDVLRKDLYKAARKLPKAARVVLRKNVDLFMSKDFFYDEATSKIFNRTHVEMCNLYFLFKKWPRENQQGGEFISDMIVEIYNYRDFVNGTLNHTEALLHELSHAWHALLGFEHQEILDNFSRCNKSGIYFNVPSAIAGLVPRTYGIQDPRELWASLSVAFLRGYNDYWPFTRQQLKEYDPESFNLLRKLWNSPQNLLVDKNGFSRDGHIKAAPLD